MSSQVRPANAVKPQGEVWSAGLTLPSRCHLPRPASRLGNFIPDRENIGGARRDRTDDLMLAKHPLYQLSYGPIFMSRSGELSSDPRRYPGRMVGLGRLELPTLRLSGVRSNHLSYRPMTAAQDGSVPGLAIALQPQTAATIVGKRNEDGDVPHLCRCRRRTNRS
jgi:hypothetical protein